MSANLTERAGRLRDAVKRELRLRPGAYIVLALFTVAGPVASSFFFPEAPLGVSIVGGFVLGGYAALCAVPDKFL